MIDVTPPNRRQGDRQQPHRHGGDQQRGAPFGAAVSHGKLTVRIDRSATSRSPAPSARAAPW
jgi:hypothetical protein